MGDTTTPWTHFHDMHSGGGTKVEPYDHIYIQAPIDDAKTIFYNRFNRNPDRVTCTCCGPDYSVNEKPTLKQATGYQRNCRHLKTPKDENGRYKNHLPEIQNQYYLEPGEDPPEGFEVDERNLFGEYVPLEEFVERDDILVIPEEEIDAEETEGRVPEEGYKWA